MSESESIVTQPPLRILSLDGGGYRGLASLEILDRLMNELKRDDGSVPLPCEVFDFIIGTSTGGLIAILLGRLRLSVEKARDIYIEFGEKIFGKLAEISSKPEYWMLTGTERFKSGPFEEVLDKLVQNSPLLDPHPTPCRAVILTTEKGTVHSSPVLLRTYPSKEPLLPNGDSWTHDWTIKEAARATSAAPTYFPSLHITDHGVEKRFEDAGAASCNNPVRQGLMEVRDRIPEFKGRHIGCVVSLGTGLGDIWTPRGEKTNSPPSSDKSAYMAWYLMWNRKDITQRATEFLEYLAKIATDTQKADEEMQHDHPVSDVYRRLDVPGLGKIDLADITKGPFLRKETRKWLDGAGKSIIDDCVRFMNSQTIPSFELNPIVFSKPTCVGRTDIIEELSKTISSAIVSETEFKPRSILIQGALGIGKSTVALQVMNDPRVKKAYGNRICYLRCDGTLDIASLKSKLLAMRAIDGGKVTDEGIRRLLAAAPTLVCLDNFEHLLHAEGGIQAALEEQLLPLIAANASLIVTVRGTPNIQLNVSGGWSSSTTLATLNPAFTREAFLKYAGQSEPTDEAQRTALDKIVEKCDGHPLTIQLLARQANARSYDEILTSLSNSKAGDAIANKLDSNAHTGSLGASVRLSVEERGVREMPSAIALCCVLAMLPDGASPEFLNRDLIDSTLVVANAKALLIERGLAYVEPERKFLRMLGPLRMFFEALDPEEHTAYGVDIPKLYNAVCEFHFALAKKSIFHVDNETRALLLYQTRNVEAAVVREIEKLSSDPPTPALTAVVEAACGVSGWYGWRVGPHAAPYLHSALELVKKGDNPVLVSHLQLEIGRDLSDENYEEAIKVLTDAYDVCMKYIGDHADETDGMDQEESKTYVMMYQRAAVCSEERARLASSEGDFEAAQTWADEALDIYNTVENEQGRLNAFIVVAGIQKQRGEFEAAVASYETALELATTIEDSIGQANASRSLSELVPKMEDKRRLLEQAAELFDKINMSDAAAECRNEIQKLERI